MITYTDQAAERLEEMRKHAKETGTLEQLNERLSFIHRFNCRQGASVRIYTDFSLGEMALGFTILRGEDHMLTGGLVYHRFDNSWGVHS